MQEQIIDYLASENGYNLHVWVFIALLLGGLGFPIPEDLPLLFAGLAAGRQVVSFWAIFITCYAGVVLGDLIVYTLGYFFGPSMVEAGKKSRYFPGITEARIQKVQKGLRKNRFLYIFMGRHLFPLRSITFATAGALRIPLVEFLIADLLAAFVSVFLMLGLGFLLGEALPAEVIEDVSRSIHWVAIAICGVLAIFVARKIFKRSSSEPSNSTQPSLSKDQASAENLSTTSKLNDSSQALNREIENKANSA